MKLERGVIAALLTVYMVWSSTYYALLIAVKELPPLLMSGARYVIAGLILFAVGRTAGWIAHCIEQYPSPQLIRPRAEYIGPAPVDDP